MSSPEKIHPVVIIGEEAFKSLLKTRVSQKVGVTSSRKVTTVCAADRRHITIVSVRDMGNFLGTSVHFVLGRRAKHSSMILRSAGMRRPVTRRPRFVLVQRIGNMDLEALPEPHPHLIKEQKTPASPRQ